MHLLFIPFFIVLYLIILRLDGNYMDSMMFAAITTVLCMVASMYYQNAKRYSEEMALVKESDGTQIGPTSIEAPAEKQRSITIKIDE
jgi:hypothetical protein